MFGKKVFLLLGGYIAGNVVASLYSDKKGKDIKTELKKAKKDGKDEISVLFENIFQTQKHFFDEAHRFFTSEKNKQLFHSKIQDIKEYSDTFKKQAQDIVKEFQGIGSPQGSELREKLEGLYKNSKDKIHEHFQNISPEKIEQLKSQLQLTYQDIKKTLKK